MVPLWSAAFWSIHSTILVAIGRHEFLRFLWATSLHGSLGAYILVLCLAVLVSAMWATSHVLHVLVCRTISFVLAIQIVFACVGCFMRHMLLVVPLRLQAVREDDFCKVVIDQARRDCRSHVLCCRCSSSDRSTLLHARWMPSMARLILQALARSLQRFSRKILRGHSSGGHHVHSSCAMYYCCGPHLYDWTTQIVCTSLIRWSWSV